MPFRPDRFSGSARRPAKPAPRFTGSQDPLVVKEKSRTDEARIAPPTHWEYFTVTGIPLPATPGSLLFRVHLGFFEGRLGVGFLFVRIQLRLEFDLVGF